MRHSRFASAVAAVATLATVATAGCGFGEGKRSEGEATLTVTRDYGTVPVAEATVSDPSESETVIRLLDRETEITTRYGGGFVHSIDGLAGEIADGRSRDWFFFTNGIESSRGSADVTVRAGDRIWWDYRDWTDALRTPAVVGSWPEPFAQEAAGEERQPVRIDCEGDRSPCEAAANRLAEAGVEAEVGDADLPPDRSALRLLVGPWSEIRRDPVAAELTWGPQRSGVFARFTGGSSPALIALDERAADAERLEAGAGLVAGLRRGEDPPTWVVTGTDPAGVQEAAALLDSDSLANRYAVAVSDGTEIALPAQSGN